jgi:2-iminoacetate synthase ThiH
MAKNCLRATAHKRKQALRCQLPSAAIILFVGLKNKEQTIQTIQTILFLHHATAIATANSQQQQHQQQQQQQQQTIWLVTW